MSYVVTDSSGMGFISEALSAVGTFVGGMISLDTTKDLLRQQRADAAALREEAWAAELSDIELARFLELQDAQVLAAQNAIIEEQNRILEEQERIVGHERVALEAEIRRGELEAERRAREEAALSFRIPTWGWFALAGLGIAGVVGAGAFMGLKSAKEVD